MAAKKKPKHLRDCEDGDVVRVVVGERKLVVQLMTPLAGDWRVRRYSFDPPGRSRDAFMLSGKTPVDKVLQPALTAKSVQSEEYDPLQGGASGEDLFAARRGE